MFKGDFIKNLPKIYGTYTGGFAVFIILMAIAEQAGVSAKNIGVMFVAFTVLIYALIGYLSRTIQVDAYYVAGRQVPTVFNGMATAADWMSGASFVALAGGVYFGGYTYMAFLVGWTGGYVLVATLMAPCLILGGAGGVGGVANGGRLERCAAEDGGVAAIEEDGIVVGFVGGVGIERLGAEVAGGVGEREP